MMFLIIDGHRGGGSNSSNGSWSRSGSSSRRRCGRRSCGGGGFSSPGVARASSRYTPPPPPAAHSTRSSPTPPSAPSLVSVRFRHRFWSRRSLGLAEFYQPSPYSCEIRNGRAVRLRHSNEQRRVRIPRTASRQLLQDSSVSVSYVLRVPSVPVSISSSACQTLFHCFLSSLYIIQCLWEI